MIKFRNVETGEDYPETLEKVKFSGITWTKDNKGIFYGCYPHHDLSAATGTDTGELKDQKVCSVLWFSVWIFQKVVIGLILY